MLTKRRPACGRFGPLEAFTLCVLVVLPHFGICLASPASEEVLKAYQLRMSGKADQAKALLEMEIAGDPQNAQVHYELARTVLHMGFGAPRDIEANIATADTLMARAVELDAENVIYRFLGARVAFLRAYMAMQRDDANVKQLVEQMSEAHESVLTLQPDYDEASLYLVEIHAALPTEMGGDKAKAEEYAKKLAARDAVWGAKAQAILLQEDADHIEYWQGVLAEHPENPDVLHEMGRAYLYNDDVEKGSECFEKAAALDPQSSYLHLDVARYHIMRGWRDEAWSDKGLEFAEKAINTFLKSEPPAPLGAYALGLLSKVKSGRKDKAGAENAHQEANDLDPYYSKAMGVPAADLFVPPGEVSRSHRYLFVPF